MKDITITQWIENFDAGKYDASDIDTQCDAGWYDWFCKDKSLRNKTYKLAKKVKKIAKILGKEFCDTHYVFFKNNCPMSGKLYDDFRFCDMKEGNVVYTITPKSGHNVDEGKSFVWGRDEKGEFGKLAEGSWKDIVNWFITNKRGN